MILVKLAKTSYVTSKMKLLGFSLMVLKRNGIFLAVRKESIPIAKCFQDKMVSKPEFANIFATNLYDAPNSSFLAKKY
jgi:hypothetical protein